MTSVSPSSEQTVLFLVLRKQLIWCFASIKRGVTIVISYENISKLMTAVFDPLVLTQL